MDDGENTLHRYRRDSTATTEWMNKARERLNGWKGHMTTSGQVISDLNEFIVSSYRFDMQIHDCNRETIGNQWAELLSVKKKKIVPLIISV